MLEATRRAIGSFTYSAQYQQNPMPLGGNVIQRDWLRYYDKTPSRFDRVIVAWDTASTLSESSDWSVGMVWGAVGSDYYILEVRRARLEAYDLRKAIVALSAAWNADTTLIEDTELGRALSQMSRHDGELCPILRRPRFDKTARLLAQSARSEAGQVHVPREAPWLATYVNELLAFPAGQHDDQVDATRCALLYLSERNGRAQPRARCTRASIPSPASRRAAEDATMPPIEAESPPAEPLTFFVPASWQPGDLFPPPSVRKARGERD